MVTLAGISDTEKVCQILRFESSFTSTLSLMEILYCLCSIVKAEDQISLNCL